MAGVTPSAYFGFLKDGMYTDFTITCKDFVYNVHKVIVCGASLMLHTACQSNFQEAVSNKIDFPEEDAEILARVVLYMYTSDYDPDKIPDFLVPQKDQSPAVQVTLQKKKQKKPEDIAEAPDATDAQVLLHPGQWRYKRIRGRGGRAVHSGSDSKELTSEAVYDSSMIERLEMNALVQKCADMLGIDNLKLSAAERFLTDARLVLPESAFAEPLRLMFESTRPDDDILRMPVVAMCVKSYSFLTGVPEIVSVMEKHEYSAWMMLKLVNREELTNTVAKINERLTSGCCNTMKPQKFKVDNEGVVSSICGVAGCGWRKI